MADFKKMLKLDVSKETKKIGDYDYLPWAKAWQIAEENSEIHEFTPIKDENGCLYHCDDIGNCWVETEVNLDGETKGMFLPILDENNIDIRKENLTFMDVNRALMRCYVKNLALFGIGLSVYQAEEEPNGEPLSPVPTGLDTNEDDEPAATESDTSKKGFSIETATEEEKIQFMQIPLPMKWKENKGRKTVEIINMILPTAKDKEEKLKNKDDLMEKFSWCINNDKCPKVESPLNISFKEYCSGVKFFTLHPEEFAEIIKKL